jgi:hypothetical protein
MARIADHGDGRMCLRSREAMPETPFEDREARAERPRFKYAVIYTHWGEGDAWRQVFSVNLRRLLAQRAGKANARGPIPVVTGSDDAAMLLERQRHRAIAFFQRALARLECKLDAYCQEPQLDTEKIARLTAERNHERERMDAATQTRIYGPGALGDLQEPQNTKIEVVHHGWAGYPYLMATSGESPVSLPIEDLPLHWKSHGLSPEIGSIRLNACSSGDAVPREHLISYPRGYYGPPSDRRTALAQYLADAMQNAGFAQPRVTRVSRNRVVDSQLSA